MHGQAGGEGEIVAVDDLSFTLAEGESLAIVGESGSGKTTLARMLVGLERPTSGRITMAGRRPQHAGPHDVRAATARPGDADRVSGPYSSLDPRQTPASSIDEVLRLHFRLSRAACAARVTELAAQGRPGRPSDDRPAAGPLRRPAPARRDRPGARRRATRPHLLDEAVASLDVSIQAQILNLLADIRGGHRHQLRRHQPRPRRLRQSPTPRSLCSAAWRSSGARPPTSCTDHSTPIPSCFAQRAGPWLEAGAARPSGAGH